MEENILSMLGKIKSNEVTADALQYKHMIAGRPKSGKTSLFYGVVKEKYKGDMSKGLLIAFEKGYQALNGIHAIDIETWEDFQELVDELVDSKDEVSYEIIALDTIDVLIKRATEYTLRTQSIKDKKRYTAINDLAYGKGYELLDTNISEQVDKLDHAGYNLFFITHDKDKTVKQRDGMEYDKTVISAGGRAGEYFKNSADMIHFIDITKELDKGKKVDKRYIHFRGDGDLEAGSRFPDIVDKVEYGVDNFINAIEDAIRAEYAGDQKAVDKAKKNQEKMRKEEQEEEDNKPTPEELIAEIDKEVKKLKPAQKKELAEKLKEECGGANYKKFDDEAQLQRALTLAKSV